MSSGELRHYVSYQKLSGNRGLAGGAKNEWVEVFKAWSRISPLLGKALFAAQQNHSEVTGKIKLRYRADINAKMRAVYNGKVYSIHAVIDVELLHKEIILMVSEGVSES